MATIQNYGHFWAEKDVHWNFGGKSDKGHLKGFKGRGTQPSIIDFRSQIGIYVLFAPNREVIYVGQVGSGERRRLFGRLKQHKSDHLRGRWSHFSWFGLLEADPINGSLKDFTIPEYEKTSEILDELEAVLIHLFDRA